MSARLRPIISNLASGVKINRKFLYRRTSGDYRIIAPGWRFCLGDSTALEPLRYRRGDDRFPASRYHRRTGCPKQDEGAARRSHEIAARTRTAVSNPVHPLTLVRAFARVGKISHVSFFGIRFLLSLQHGLDVTRVCIARLAFLAAARSDGSVPLRGKFGRLGDEFGTGGLCTLLRVVPIGGTHRSIFQTPQLEVLCAQFLSAHGVARRNSAKECALSPTK